MTPSILVLLLLAVAPASPGPDDADAVRREIERHNASAIRAYATGDADALAALFAEDGWQMPPNNPPLIGREAVRGFWREALKWGRWDFTLRVQNVAVSGPLAVERGTYVLGFTAGAAAPPGMASFEDRGNYLVHWRREGDGEWRIAADAPVSELPLPAGPPAPSAAAATPREKCQLRLFTINRDQMADFIGAWQSGVVPLRQKQGFTIRSAWTVPETNQFFWLLCYDGPEDFDAKDKAYYSSPERTSLANDPRRFIARIERWFAEPVVAGR